LYFLVTVQYTQNLTAIPLNFIACKICKIKIAVIYLISNFPFVHHFLSRFDVRCQGINGLFAMFKGFLKRSKDIQLMSFLGEQKIRDSIYSNNLWKHKTKNNILFAHLYPNFNNLSCSFYFQAPLISVSISNFLFFLSFFYFFYLPLLSLSLHSCAFFSREKNKL